MSVLWRRLLVSLIQSTCGRCAAIMCREEEKLIVSQHQWVTPCFLAANSNNLHNTLFVVVQRHLEEILDCIIKPRAFQGYFVS